MALDVSLRGPIPERHEFIKGQAGVVTRDALLTKLSHHIAVAGLPSDFPAAFA